MNIRLATLFIVLPVVLAAQAAIEAGIVTSRRAASTAATSGKAGKSISGAFDRVNQTLKQNSEATPDPAPTAVKSSAPKQPAAATAKAAAAPQEKLPKKEVVFEDPAGIQEGMESGEVLRRFGPPSLQFTTGSEETFCYTKNASTIDATLRNGRVAVIKKKVQP